MSERPIIPLQITADPDAETRTAATGPYTLVLTTALPGIALELHATYVGHPSERTVATILALAPGQPPRLLPVVSIAAVALSTTEGRLTCLYHFLGVLADELRDLGIDPAIDVGEDALRALATLRGYAAG
jgi:hypothetical protein